MKTEDSFFNICYLRTIILHGMAAGLLIRNIGTLVQTDTEHRLSKRGSEMSEIGTIGNAYLYARDGIIDAFGPMGELDERRIREECGILNVIDAGSKFVFPSFCDSHTHIVYAGSREMEFTDKIKGLSYEEIARRGGGILNSAKLLHETDEDELFRQSAGRIKEIIGLGTGARQSAAIAPAGRIGCWVDAKRAG